MVDLPNSKMVIFHCYGKLPEGAMILLMGVTMGVNGFNEEISWHIMGSNKVRLDWLY